LRSKRNGFSGGLAGGRKPGAGQTQPGGDEERKEGGKRRTSSPAKGAIHSVVSRLGAASYRAGEMKGEDQMPVLYCVPKKEGMLQVSRKEASKRPLPNAIGRKARMWEGMVDVPPRRLGEAPCVWEGGERMTPSSSLSDLVKGEKRSAASFRIEKKDTIEQFKRYDHCVGHQKRRRKKEAGTTSAMGRKVCSGKKRIFAECTDGEIILSASQYSEKRSYWKKRGIT